MNYVILERLSRTTNRLVSDITTYQRKVRKQRSISINIMVPWLILALILSWYFVPEGNTVTCAIVTIYFFVFFQQVMVDVLFINISRIMGEIFMFLNKNVSDIEHQMRILVCSMLQRADKNYKQISDLRDTHTYT